uniref:B9 domain-containing protein 1 n=2 Tax=Phaeomonas parva TaxID=124430 RepID=A0A7S1U318_9STRA|mmetsp:Transcript_29076/g.93021  ORF Transcript_29076/g.93021 Transcript_29076/m.93021 type:complete len:237 (+) Transcript_29076:202-912(+)
MAHRDRSSRRRAAEAPSAPSEFHLMVTGQIRSGDFDGADNLYCRYSLVFGHDWTVCHGPDSGLSQIARRGGGVDPALVWNFPIDATFKSTNPFGWPRIAISVYGVDGLGRDVIKGYGSVVIPTCPGKYERVVHMYAPVSSSLAQQLLAWIGGTPPEFFDSSFTAQGTGRDVTRVRACGTVRVTLNVLPRGLAAFGYDYGEGAGAGTGPHPKPKPNPNPNRNPNPNPYPNRNPNPKR